MITTELTEAMQAVFKAFIKANPGIIEEAKDDIDELEGETFVIAMERGEGNVDRCTRVVGGIDFLERGGHCRLRFSVADLTMLENKIEFLEWGIRQGWSAYSRVAQQSFPIVVEFK